jgi:magnesium chelatase family protein
VNPCPCGYLGHARIACRCSKVNLARYQSRLSGPLLDRIDIHVQVPPVEVSALIRKGGGESSSAMRDRVMAARERQRSRSKKLFGRPYLNASVPARELEELVRLSHSSRKLLEGAVTSLGLSARAFNKVLRVARTSADLDGADDVNDRHVTEGIQGRLLDREPKI